MFFSKKTTQMNIFVLNTDPKLCAEQHCDRHVVKMILESAQILSTAHHILDPTNTEFNKHLYKATHKNHPCTIWARETKGNYLWLYSLLVELCREYTHRYGKIHKTSNLLQALKNPPIILTDPKITEWPQAMPLICRRPSTTEAYQNYYMTHKQSFATWHNRKQPDWYKPNKAQQ